VYLYISLNLLYADARLKRYFIRRLQ